MSYVLDGIKTEMALHVHGEVTYATCPCGWESKLWHTWQNEAGTQLLSSMRFHFTHCPAAKPEPCAHIFENGRCRNCGIALGFYGSGA